MSISYNLRIGDRPRRGSCWWGSATRSPRPGRSRGLIVVILLLIIIIIILIIVSLTRIVILALISTNIDNDDNVFCNKITHKQQQQRKQRVPRSLSWPRASRIVRGIGEMSYCDFATNTGLSWNNKIIRCLIPDSRGLGDSKDTGEISCICCYIRN